MINRILKNEEATRRVFYLFLLFFGFLVGGGLSKTLKAQEASQMGIFYQITGKGLKQPSYLLGTYHLLNSGYLQQFQAITKALEQAQGAVVEVELDNNSAAVMAKYTMLPPGMRTTGLLEKGVADSLDQLLKQQIGAGLAAFDGMKPANISTSLSLFTSIKDNDSLLKSYTGQPMDQWVAASTKKAGKKLYTLETLEEQIKLLLDYNSPEEQARQLTQLVRQFESGRKIGNDLVQAYIQHDLLRMEALAQKAMEISGQATHLLEDRNLRWMAVLPGLIQKQSQFIAVGALHLAGPTGLVAQLKALGYNVLPVKL
ncbi:MAG TPA: TraB/GumN family protein [Phnomibacter sp.]|nr:TraB/GumN family protein [Phnomibacter sp.]